MMKGWRNYCRKSAKKLFLIDLRKVNVEYQSFKFDYKISALVQKIKNKKKKHILNKIP